MTTQPEATYRCFKISVPVGLSLTTAMSQEMHEAFTWGLTPSAEPGRSQCHGLMALAILITIARHLSNYYQGTFEKKKKRSCYPQVLKGTGMPRPHSEVAGGWREITERTRVLPSLGSRQMLRILWVHSLLKNLKPNSRNQGSGRKRQGHSFRLPRAFSKRNFMAGEAWLLVGQSAAVSYSWQGVYRQGRL